MHDQTDRADHGEQNKARRKGAGGRVVNNQAKKVDADQRRSSVSPEWRLRNT